MAVAIAALGDATSKTSGTTLNVDAPASVAVGDLLIIHIMSDSSITDPSGWTLIQSGSQSRLMKAYYKIADSSDAAAGSFSVTTGNEASAGRCFRITGHDSGSPIGASNVGTTANDSTVTVSTITPAAANSMFLWLVGAFSAGSARTASGYAMATSNPTWTEQYDEQWDSNNNQFSAASALRPEATATGSLTATLSGLDPNIGIVIAITPATINVTPTPTVLSATFSIVSPTIKLDMNFSVSAVTGAITLNAPTISIGEAETQYTAETKHSTSPSTTSKNSATWSTTNKNSSTWTAEDKNL